MAGKRGGRALNDRQERFIARYVVHLNATRAYKEAGYAPNTQRAAESQASALLRNPEVARAIGERQRAAIQASDLTQERILRELARIGLHDPRRLYGPDGELKPVPELDDDSAAAISSIESTISRSLEAPSSDDEESKLIATTLKKLKVHDKLSALTLAMRHHGMLTDQVKISGSVETAVRYVANMPVRGSED